MYSERLAVHMGSEQLAVHMDSVQLAGHMDLGRFAVHTAKAQEGGSAVVEGHTADHLEVAQYGQQTPPAVEAEDLEQLTLLHPAVLPCQLAAEAVVAECNAPLAVH